MRTEVPIVVLDPSGNPVVGALVQINVRGGAVATVYQFETGTSTYTNPLTTDSAGRVTGWLERGAYDAVISATGLTTYTEQFESVPARDGAIDTGWLADSVVTGTKVAAGAIQASHFAAGAVSTTGVVPIGGVLEWPYAAADIPNWSLLGYGQGVSLASYPALYTLASNAGFPHGGGGGVFNMIDYRGRVGAGKDDMGGVAASRVTVAVSGVNGATLGAAGGAEGVTLTTATIPAHNHPVTGSPGLSDPGHYHTVGIRANSGAGPGASGVLSDNQGTTNSDAKTTGITVSVGSLGTSNAGSGSAHQNVQPTVIVNKIVRVI